MKPIPYGKHHISQSDIDEVEKVLRSEYLTQGPNIEAFEKAFASYVGSRYAVAVSNGTAALHICAIALDVRPGDKVITTPITFVASANCVHFCGGEVVFADIDPDTYLIDIDNIRTILETSRPGEYQGIIPVDFAGRAVDMRALKELADEFGLWIIEDSCHAPGGYYSDLNGTKQYCGSGQFSDLAIFSFHPVKHIASGEGGMVTTNNESLYHRLLRLRTHGITKEKSHFENSVDIALGNFDHLGKDRQEDLSKGYPGWYMEMQELGYNYRLTDFQAALGISQLKRASTGIEKRRLIASRYHKAFQKQPFIKGQSGVVVGHAYHLYIIEVENRRNLYDFLRGHNIYAQIHYIPCHLMPYYRQFGWVPGDFPLAENYYSRCMSLPMFPDLSEDEQNFVINKIYEFFKA